ncbi:hypothetical protein Agabi119p4_8472 [Agaricus bisporus var. burnettii]|uniref:Uncharacterized protein n=1 Tax=Agaricus bisporus var. burnettii TaxID=192524 RepID=A0A8H7EYJ4_AGABI|nr:hypothetical protein Agabi119p4_8472 [Agaricus bisporus var. burnettii]
MHRPKLQNALHNPIPAGQNQSKNFVSFTNLSPQTSAEHYWASRALKAEALLSAREKHFEEVGKVRQDEEAKRKNELQSLEARYKEKYNNLERLLVVLALVMALLLVLLTYVVASHNNAANKSSFQIDSIFIYIYLLTSRYQYYPLGLPLWKIRPQAPSVLQPPPVSTPFS